MNIVKPQKVNLEQMEITLLSSVNEDENLMYSIFQNEECNNINLQQLEFEYNYAKSKVRENYI